MSRFTLLNSQFANQNRCSEAPFAWILEKLTRTVGRMILPSPALRLTLAPDFSFEGVCTVYDRKNMAVFQYTKFSIEEQEKGRKDGCTLIPITYLIIILVMTHKMSSIF